MTLEQWAYVAQIVGVIVVIASLVYVAMQVRQNTVTQIAASREAILTADLELLSWAMEHPEDALGLGENTGDIRSTAFLVAYVRIREFMWYQYENGILDKTTWESYLAPTAAVFESDMARRLWNANVIKLDARFRMEMDRLVSEQGRSSSAERD